MIAFLFSDDGKRQLDVIDIPGDPVCGDYCDSCDECMACSPDSCWPDREAGHCLIVYECQWAAFRTNRPGAVIRTEP